VDRVAHTDSGQVRAGVGAFPVVLQGRLILIGETKIYKLPAVSGIDVKESSEVGIGRRNLSSHEVVSLMLQLCLLH